MRREIPVRVLERDTSWSSTLAVDHPAAKQDQPFVNFVIDVPRPKKNVSFNDSANVYFESELDETFFQPAKSEEDETQESYWYQASDYDDFRENMKFTIQTVVDFENILKREELAREREQGMASPPSSLFIRVLEDAHEACRYNYYNEKEHKALTALYSSHFNVLRIGLERHTVQALHNGTSSRRNRQRKLVKELRQCSYNIHDAENAERVRDICLSISRPARLFSTVLAQAQAANP